MRFNFGTDVWKFRKDTEKHFLVGLKLDCTRLCNDLLCKELSTFNRLHWAHCLTGRNMLQLSTSDKNCITAFELTKTPTAYLKETEQWVRHCQLSWDRTGSKPNWVNCENITEWSTTLPEDNTSPTDEAKSKPNWLTHSALALKVALFGMPHTEHIKPHWNETLIG